MPRRLPIFVSALSVPPLAAAANSSGTRLLRIGLYHESLEPWTKRDPVSGLYYAGFLIDFYKEMGFLGGYEVEFVPITDTTYTSNFTGVTQRLLREGVIDMGWDSNMTLHPGYAYTCSMFYSESTILTRKEPAAADMWQVFAPFETAVWLWILGAIFFGAAVLAALSSLYSDEYCWQSFPRLFYHTFAAILGGDEYDLYHVPPFGRLYRLGLLFTVIVLTATYTANLAAFLTRAQFRLSGPQSIDDLSNSTGCVRWPQWSDEYAPFFDRLVLPSPEVLSNGDRYTWARQLLHEGGCDAIVDVKPHLKPESLHYCNSMHYNPDISFLPQQIYNVLLGSNAELAYRVSEAIYRTKMLPSYAAMVDRNMRYGTSCSDLVLTTEEKQITALQLSPNFFLYAFCSSAAVLVTALQRCRNGGKPLASVKEEVQNEKLDVKLNSVLAELATLRTSLEFQTAVL